jgi:hypothetical protein
MKWIKKFEDLSSNTKHFDKINLANKVIQAKKDVYKNMNPPSRKVFDIVDDLILYLHDDYGKVTSKYGDVRDVIDFTWLELKANIGSVDGYTIAYDKNFKWISGNKIDTTDDVDRDIDISHYGNDILDGKFLNWYTKYKEGKVKPFYSFMLGFDSSYGSGIENWTEDEIKEMSDVLIKTVKNIINRLSSYYKCEIIEIEAMNLIHEWKKIGTNINNIKFPRFVIDFTVEKK